MYSDQITDHAEEYPVVKDALLNGKKKSYGQREHFTQKGTLHFKCISYWVYNVFH